jgi:predicted dehydrogenase/nucleoside-diphosphate-sugar epimerase
VAPLRIAFVGAGNIARLHVHALRRVRTPHAIVAVHDTNETASLALATAAGATSYPSLASLLAEARPDVVHICTPAGAHFDPARQALNAGAHVYVEKPFAETVRDAWELLALAEQKGLLVCAGHQQVRDPAYVTLCRRLRKVGEAVQVDGHFTFQPVGVGPRAEPRLLAAQLLDVLPHPLSTLVDAFERVVADPSAVRIAAVAASATDLHATFQAERGYARLSVSLRARPIASLLSVKGTGGELTADLLHESVVGTANPGTAPLEKAANPLIEAWQLAIQTVVGVAKRVASGGDYPGMPELMGEFYAAVASGGTSPTSPEQLLRITGYYEELAANVHGASGPSGRRGPPPDPGPKAPLAVMTGARGFFGSEIAAQLVRRGYRVRGISRTPDMGSPSVHEWAKLDLARDDATSAFAGADVVVHAAAATEGGFEQHERNTIETMRAVLRSMYAAEVTRLVLVSSLSVLRPPRSPWEQQDEQTPLLAADARALGPYAWAKAEAERIAYANAPKLGIDLKVLRPGALVDWRRPELPGLVGRRLFGHWYLGFGRPGLPFPACEVRTAAAITAWYTQHFEDTAPVLHVIDDALASRRRLLALLKRNGWQGRMCWIPIPLFAGLVHAARALIGLVTFRRPKPFAVWSILRPRHFAPGVNRLVLDRAPDEARLQPVVAGL